MKKIIALLLTATMILSLAGCGGSASTSGKRVFKHGFDLDYPPYSFINEDGTQELVKLKDKDVGAIYTKSAETEFALNDLSSNETRARIRKTGIFLYESGMMGTVQHLDLAQ